MYKTHELTPPPPKKIKGFFIFSRKPNKGEKQKGIKPICENHKNKTKKRVLGSYP